MLECNIPFLGVSGLTQPLYECVPVGRRRRRGIGWSCDSEVPSRDRETVSGTDFGDRMGVVADSSRNPLSTRSMWRATGADGAGFARRYWLSPNSANAWPLQGRIDIVAF